MNLFNIFKRKPNVVETTSKNAQKNSADFIEPFSQIPFKLTNSDIIKLKKR